MFSNAIISGWDYCDNGLDVPFRRQCQNCGNHINTTWLIVLADTTHIVVGTVEILYLVFLTARFTSDRFLWLSALPTLAGNICEPLFFALLSHAQIRRHAPISVKPS